MSSSSLLRSLTEVRFPVQNGHNVRMGVVSP